MDLFLFLIFSLIVGSIARYFMNDGNGDFFKDSILGVFGCCLGGFLNFILGFSKFFAFGGLISGIIGSCLILWLAKKYKGK